MARTRTVRRSARPAPKARGASGPGPHIDPREFARRREQVLKAIAGSVGLVFAGDAEPSLHGPYMPHAHFRYLTGITDEPGAVLLLDPGNPNPAWRVRLFLKPLNPEREKWDGFRHPISAALKARTGIDAIHRTDMLAGQLLVSARRARSLSLLMPLSPHTAPVSPDLEVFRRSCERIPGCSIQDRSQLLAQMRARKSDAEVACIEHAGRITGLGFHVAMATLRPGMNEFDLQRNVEEAYREGGARDLAFPTIAGGGFNSTVLHYHGNDQMLQAGDLVCLDSGAKWAGYSADVTRTLPVSGRFTARQREIYELVLKAQRAAIKACRPGRRLHQVDEAGRAIIRKAGLADAFPHGMGHHLGLETHDITPDEPLAEGAVVTIEPGIYLPEERIGIRIEDDVLVTRRGPRVLTGHIPSAIADIERLMRR
ncbi:MAG: aminopeptidase P family protein [Planctomycetes bacterium]|nr:aminopeptidase P family protein [Planctomycetota bacterium]